MTHFLDLLLNYSFFLINIRSHSYSLAVKRLSYASSRLLLFVSQQIVLAEHVKCKFPLIYLSEKKFFEV